MPRQRAVRYQSEVYLVIAGLSGAAYLLGVEIPVTVQAGLLAGAVALFGLPHGALDPVVARTSGIVRSPAGFAAFLALYTVCAAVTAFVWLSAPLPALITFLLLSIWHFRNDWQSTLPPYGRIATATGVVAFPTMFYPGEVTDLFATLTFGADVSLLVDTLRLVGIAGLTGLLISAIRVARKQNRLALELVSIPVLAAILPPLLFFLVYFCALHSPRHMIGAIQSLNIETKVIVSTVLLFSGLAVTAAAYVYAWLPGADSLEAIVHVVFIGLAALTVPHMLLIERVERRRK